MKDVIIKHKIKAEVIVTTHELQSNVYIINQKTFPKDLRLPSITYFSQSILKVGADHRLKGTLNSQGIKHLCHIETSKNGVLAISIKSSPIINANHRGKRTWILKKIQQFWNK
jgi:hypothetical protein